MIEKIQISDASIAEEIRKNINVATEEEKGLMSSSDKMSINQTLLYGNNYNAIKIKEFASWERSSLIIHGMYFKSPYSFILSMYNVQNDTPTAPFVFITKITNSIPFKIYYKKEGSYLDLYLLSTYPAPSTDAERFNILGNKKVEILSLTIDDTYTEITV